MSFAWPERVVTAEASAVLDAAEASTNGRRIVEPVDILLALVTIGQGVADDVRWSVGWTVEDGDWEAGAFGMPDLPEIEAIRIQALTELLKLAMSRAGPGDVIGTGALLLALCEFTYFPVDGPAPQASRDAITAVFGRETVRAVQRATTDSWNRRGKDC